MKCLLFLYICDNSTVLTCVHVSLHFCYILINIFVIRWKSQQGFFLKWDTLLFRTSFSFLISSKLESLIISFSQNSLLSYISSVCLLIIFCSFMANSTNWLLVSFLSYFLVKMLLPTIFIRFLSCHLILVEDMYVLNEWLGSIHRNNIL